MTTTQTPARWFTTRTASNGRPDLTVFDGGHQSDASAAEGFACLLDTLELGSRAAKVLAR